MIMITITVKNLQPNWMSHAITAEKLSEIVNFSHNCVFANL